jgi:RNA polymerase sigma-70 factor (ECF subfamily)
MQATAPNLFELYEKCICRQGDDSDSCELFFTYLTPLIRRVTFRVAQQFNAAADTDDIVQDVIVKLIERGKDLLDSVPRSAPRTTAYFAVMAANTARDYFRARCAERRSAGRTVTLDEGIAATIGVAALDVSVEQEFWMEQIERCLHANRRERSVFRLYYRQGFTAKELAAIPALEMTVKGVESMIRRIATKIRECINAENKETAPKGKSADKSSKESRDRAERI